MAHSVKTPRTRHTSQTTTDPDLPVFPRRCVILHYLPSDVNKPRLHLRTFVSTVHYPRWRIERHKRIRLQLQESVKSG